MVQGLAFAHTVWHFQQVSRASLYNIIYTYRTYGVQNCTTHITIKAQDLSAAGNRRVIYSRFERVLSTGEIIRLCRGGGRGRWRSGSPPPVCNIFRKNALHDSDEIPTTMSTNHHHPPLRPTTELDIFHSG